MLHEFNSLIVRNPDQQVVREDYKTTNFASQKALMQSVYRRIELLNDSIYTTSNFQSGGYSLRITVYKTMKQTKDTKYERIRKYIITPSPQPIWNQ